MTENPTLTLRLTKEHDGYEIVDERGVVKDTVTARELVEAAQPDHLMRRRVEAQHRVMRVRRFAEALARSTESSAESSRKPGEAGRET